MRRGRVIAALAAATATIGLAVPAQGAAPASPTVPKGYTWTKLVDLKVASTGGSSDIDAAAHTQTNIVVAGVNRKRVLAGTVEAGGTGVATFSLGKHCTRFSTSVGLSDDSPKAGYITFSVYFGDVAEIVKEPKHGKTQSISLNVSGVRKLVLRNTEPSPAGSLSAPEIAAWPDAKVLCKF